MGTAGGAKRERRDGHVVQQAKAGCPLSPGMVPRWPHDGEGNLRLPIRHGEARLNRGPGCQTGSDHRIWADEGIGVDPAATLLSRLVEQVEIRPGMDALQRLRVGGLDPRSCEGGLGRRGAIGDARDDGIDPLRPLGVAGGTVARHGRVAEEQHARHAVAASGGSGE